MKPVVLAERLETGSSRRPRACWAPVKYSPTQYNASDQLPAFPAIRNWNFPYPAYRVCASRPVVGGSRLGAVNPPSPQGPRA